MSRNSKILFFVAALLVFSAMAIDYVMGMSLNLSMVLYGLAGLLASGAVFFDRKLYFEFLFLRTTKHGMNMGFLILLVFTLIVCLNYLANQHNKTWDVTKEKLNSPAEQTVGLLKGLKHEMIVRTFYKGAEANEVKQNLKLTLKTYQEFSPNVRVEFINAYVDTALAIKYLSDQSDRQTEVMFVFIEYDGRKVRVDAPYDEAQLTSAMIKVTREGATNKIYFITGHGEKDLEGHNDQGLSEFAASMEQSSFKPESLNLLEKKSIPDDAAAVAIIGPQNGFLTEEMNWLRDYAKKGGKILLAIDPGQRHNLANLTKSFGVEFANNYVVTRMPITSMGPATVIGQTFDLNSEVTKSLPSGSSFAIFPLASELHVAPDKPGTLDIKEIVKTDSSTFTITDPTRPVTQIPATAPVTVAMEVSGQIDQGKDTHVVIVGDSDFLSNRAYMIGVNRDLALNIVAALANQKDLLSIRPKVPEGAMLVLTRIERLAIVVVGLMIPFVLLVSSSIIWFRRRGA